MSTVYTNETEKAKRVLAEILGQHSEELLPLLECLPSLWRIPSIPIHNCEKLGIDGTKALAL